MIDRDARKILSEQLRRLISGQITNDEFESVVLSVKTSDTGYWAVFEQAWQLYSDLSEHKIDTRSLPQDAEEAINRSILFLHSGLEFEWPKHPCTGFTRLLAGAISFGRLPQYYDEKWKAEGDYDVYPFFRRSDFETAKTKARLPV